MRFSFAVAGKNNEDVAEQAAGADHSGALAATVPYSARALSHARFVSCRSAWSNNGSRACCFFWRAASSCAARRSTRARMSCWWLAR